MITFERVWTDHCEHPEEAYIGTTGGRREPHDIYLYMADGHARLCFRYGEEPHEYISPGSVRQVAAGVAADPEHSYASDLRVVRYHLSKEISKSCYALGMTSLGAFADLFAIDPRDPG